MGVPSGDRQALLPTMPVTHRQTPPRQICPVEQGMPQPPQFIGSIAAATHCWPQAMCSAAQLGAGGGVGPFLAHVVASSVPASSASDDPALMPVVNAAAPSNYRLRRARRLLRPTSDATIPISRSRPYGQSA